MELVDDAVGALGPAARALYRMHADGLERAQSPAVRELATACAAASAAWRGLPSGRLTDLMGAAADVSSRNRWGRSERWVICVGIADSVRRLADMALRHGPYAGAAPIAAVRHASMTVARFAVQQRPSLQALAALDNAVPVVGLPRGLRGSQIAAESAVALEAELRRLGHLRLFEGLCVLRAAETAADCCAAADGTASQQAAASWRSARSLLRAFDDGTRTRPEPTNVLLWTVRLDRGLRAELGAAADRQQLRIVAGRLPAIATHMEAAAQRWGSEGALMVRADEVQFQERRLEAVLQRRTVMADTGDLLPAMTAIRTAGLLSIELAAELNRGVAHISSGHLDYSAAPARGVNVRANRHVRR